MDSAQSDPQAQKLEISDTDASSSSLPGATGGNGAGMGSYYQPPSGQTTAEPTPVAPPSSRTTGTVPPAPGSPVLGSVPASPESSARPNLPTMGMNASSPTVMPAAGPAATATAAPPTVSTEASANQVQQRMQAANTGDGAGKKRSLLLPILGVMVVLVIAAAGIFWWMSNQEVETTPVPLDQSLTQQEPAQEQEVQVGLEQTFEPEVPLTQEELATAQKVEVSGKICSYGETYQAGNLYFFQPLSGVVYEYPVEAGQQEFTEMIPIGSYVSVFAPSDAQLPKLAYTEFIDCGMNYDSCTDHSMSQFVLAPESTYEGVIFCDAQYEQEGLPEILEQNMSLREQV